MNTVTCDSTLAVEVADAFRGDGSLNRPLINHDKRMGQIAKRVGDKLR